MKQTIAIAVILGILRIYIGATSTPGTLLWVQIFKDVAHLFMGGLTVAAWNQDKKWQWILFWSMNTLEVTVAVISRL